MSEEHKSQTPSLRRSSRIANQRASASMTAPRESSTGASHLSASAASFTPYRPIRINIVAGDFNRPVYWSVNEEWCQSTWKMLIGKTHELEETESWKKGLQNISGIEMGRGFSPVDNIFCSGATEDYQCTKLVCETLDRGGLNKHFSEYDLFQEFIKKQRGEQYNRQIDTPPGESNCSNHAPLFSIIKAEEGSSQAADIHVLTWNVFTKGATLKAGERDSRESRGRGELWDAARLQAEVMLTRLNDMMLSPQLSLDVVCLQEYGGDFLYDTILRPIYASTYFKDALGSDLRFIHINKILMQLGVKEGDGRRDGFGSVPPIDELRVSNNIFVLINDGEPAGSIIFVRASTIDFDHIARYISHLNPLRGRRMTSTVAMNKGGTSILANITNVHDSRNGIVSDDVLTNLLINDGDAGKAGAVQKHKTKKRRKSKSKKRRKSKPKKRRKSKTNQRSRKQGGRSRKRSRKRTSRRQKRTQKIRT